MAGSLLSSAVQANKKLFRYVSFIIGPKCRNEPPIAMMLPVMNIECIHCHKNIDEEKVFFVVSDPFYGSLHQECAAHFNFYSKNWPHSQPMVYYTNQISKEET